MDKNKTWIKPLAIGVSALVVGGAAGAYLFPSETIEKVPADYITLNGVQYTAESITSLADLSGQVGKFLTIGDKTYTVEDFTKLQSDLAELQATATEEDEKLALEDLKAEAVSQFEKELDEIEYCGEDRYRESEYSVDEYDNFILNSYDFEEGDWNLSFEANVEYDDGDNDCENSYEVEVSYDASRDRYDLDY